MTNFLQLLKHFTCESVSQTRPNPPQTKPEVSPHVLVALLSPPGLCWPRVVHPWSWPFWPVGSRALAKFATLSFKSSNFFSIVLDIWRAFDYNKAVERIVKTDQQERTSIWFCILQNEVDLKNDKTRLQKWHCANTLDKNRTRYTNKWNAVYEKMCPKRSIWTDALLNLENPALTWLWKHGITNQGYACQCLLSLAMKPAII